MSKEAIPDKMKKKTHACSLVFSYSSLFFYHTPFQLIYALSWTTTKRKRVSQNFVRFATRADTYTPKD